MTGNPQTLPTASLSGPGRIYIGNQSAFSAGRLMDPFEYALANRFDAFEWFPDRKPDGTGWDESDLTPALRSDIRQAARANSVRLSVHARVRPASVDGPAEPVAPADLELAQDLGAEVLVVHLPPEAGLPAFAPALAPSLRWAVAHGIRIAVENTPASTPDQFARLFAAVGKRAASELPALGVCLDVGHANLCVSTRNDYLGYLDRVDAQVPIIHVHLHENWGEADTHLTLFTGPSQHNPSVEALLRRLRKRGYTGSFILEQWPTPPALLNHARDRLLEIWRASDEPAPRPSLRSSRARAPLP